MIRIVFMLDEQRRITQFEVKGHSGYDKPGKDIVCAAVSAIVQTAIIGLTDVVGVEVECHQADGDVKCVIPSNLNTSIRVKADVVLNTMCSGLKSIQAGYSGYVTVLERKAE